MLSGEEEGMLGDVVNLYGNYIDNQHKYYCRSYVLNFNSLGCSASNLNLVNFNRKAALQFWVKLNKYQTSNKL